MKTLKFEFISERKVVKTFDNVNETLSFAKKLQKARVKNQKSLETIWKEVGKILEIDPFLPLTIRIKDNGKVVGKKIVWKNSL